MTSIRACTIERQFVFSRITSGTARCVNTRRSLTHLLDCTERGLAMDASKRTCSDPECGRDADRRDMCGTHYQRWRRARIAEGGLPPLAPGRNVVDRMGQRFGRLVVIARAPSRPNGVGGNRTYWLCRCDCGNEIEVYQGDFSKKNHTRSCGCGENRRGTLPPGKAARNGVRQDYVSNAGRRGLCWELTEDDFDRLVSRPCHYCGQPPSQTKVLKSGDSFTYNGIDRVDNNLGYTRGNAVPCCAICNRAKRDMSYDEFVTWTGHLTEYQFFRPDMLPSRLLKDSGQAGTVAR